MSARTIRDSGFGQINSKLKKALSSVPNPQSQVPSSGSAGVIPTLAELVALRGVAQGRRPAARGWRGVSGHAPSPMRGRGMEYAESREYALGDDARHIDWRLTARSGKPHTKLFQAERERLTLLVADTAPALHFGTRVRFKSVQAARAGAVAAWHAVGEGDRVAALRGSSREPPVRPAAGPRGALRVLDALVRWYAQPAPDDDGLEVALDHAKRLLRPGSRLMVLADAASVVDIPAQRWSGLSQHSEVIALLLVDSLETDPPTALLPFMVDAPGVDPRATDQRARAGHRVRLDLRTQAQRERWQQRFVAPVDDAIARLKSCGVRVQVLRSDAASESWLGLLGRRVAT